MKATLLHGTAAAIVASWALLAWLSPAAAGDPEIVQATARCNADNVCRFDVRVRHEDSGWDHYVNKWDVVTLGGKLLGTRELLHPHETEQPFTRSLTDVRVPANTEEIMVRVYDSVHGMGSEEYSVEIVPGD